jgi:hypothetical protein
MYVYIHTFINPPYKETGKEKELQTEIKGR